MIAKHRRSISLDTGGSHAAPFGQITPDFLQALAELTGSSGDIIALVVKEANGEVDEAL